VPASLCSVAVSYCVSYQASAGSFQIRSSVSGDISNSDTETQPSPTFPCSCGISRWWTLLGWCSHRRGTTKSTPFPSTALIEGREATYFKLTLIIHSLILCSRGAQHRGTLPMNSASRRTSKRNIVYTLCLVTVADCPLHTAVNLRQAKFTGCCKSCLVLAAAAAPSLSVFWSRFNNAAFQTLLSLVACIFHSCCAWEVTR